MPYAMSLPRFKEWSDVSAVMARAISLALTGKQTPAEAAKQAQDGVYEIMKEAGYYR
jgi:maltose-binding protein MalE